ncbi:MAG: Fic family protein [Pseudomonadota bacterium]
MARPVTFTVKNLLEGMDSSAGQWLAMRDLEGKYTVARPTLIRNLNKALQDGLIELQGKGSATQYRLAGKKSTPALSPLDATVIVRPSGPVWNEPAEALMRYVRGPLASRTPVSYQASLVETYRPNSTFWLPQNLRSKLKSIGQVGGDRLIGTYARDILGQLLVDLSWESSRLEGNRYSRLETKTLIEAGVQADGKTQQEAVMILNHKKAIEFLVEVAPFDDPWHRVIGNLHSLLMDGLLPNEKALGAIRTCVVNIEGSVYHPWQVPIELERMYHTICDVGSTIEDPLEAAFFLFTQLPYLQPFEDGNKRTSRVSCNLPLARANYAPLAFIDVDDADYFGALLGLYEKADLSAAVDLFAWAYERSVQSYRAVKESMGQPDPFRVRLREALSEAVRAVVEQNIDAAAATAQLHLDAADSMPFEFMLNNELRLLSTYNYARYGLRFSSVEAWLKSAGRQ